MFDVVIGKPLVKYISTLGLTNPIYTNERYLPQILVDLKIFPSTSQVRKNKPKLCIELTDIDCIDIKIGKKRLYIVVGK